MANVLTGDFDVVAQFSVSAANRMLAAMHRAERFPHSLTLRVDDTDDTPGLGPNRPSIVATVDALGDPTVNPNRVPPPVRDPGGSFGGGPLYSVLDSVVNVDLVGVHVDPIVPSHIQGRAQLQLFPPTLDVSNAAGSRISLRMDLMARYFPDPNTARLAEFIRGPVQITAPIAQMGSQAAHVIDIDFKSPQVSIGFTPSWSSGPLSAEDLAAINLLIRNALKTSFMPSNAVIPPRIRQLLFKTFVGTTPAIAVLLNVREESGLGNPATVNSAFLGSSDDFAFAVGIDFVLATFNPTLMRILTQPIPSIPVAWSHYSVELKRGELTLEQPDRIVLTFRGDAKSPSYWLPNFGFSVRQVLKLRVDGPTADFEVKDPSFQLSSDIADWIASPFKGGVQSRIAASRDDALRDSEAHEKVRRLLNADENLGVFLNSLFAPPRNKPAPPTPAPQIVRLAYTSITVQPAGIVLHGSLAVQDWPPPHVEFGLIPQSGGPAFDADNVMQDGPDYSALKTWIPGGVIQHYEWHRQGQTPHFIDANRFVLLHQRPGVSDDTAMRPSPPRYSPLCLTISGVRLTASGPVVAQPVGATVCAYSSFPVVGGVVTADTALPMIALVERDAQGLVSVTGHTTATADATGASVPTLLVHFGDDTSVGQLQELADALREGGRDDGTTAVVAVLSGDQLRRAAYVADVTYADNRDNRWSALFGVKPDGRATTLIVSPDGKVAWRHEGEIDRQALSDALRQHVKPGPPVALTAVRSKVRIGHPPPNLLFEYAPGRTLTLRKVGGRPAVLVFWRGSAEASIDAIRELQSDERSGPANPLLLAINDGDTPEVAAKLAADAGLSAILVTDPDRAISLAYGITIWPTIIDVDALGLVRSVRYGRPAGTRGVEQHV